MSSNPQFSFRASRPATRIVAVLLLLMLSACGKDGAKPATQVAAKVNKEEISVHQINFILQRQQGIKPEQAEAASRQVLERLIDQEVAVQKALEQKLDRDPRVMQELEAARRDVIARAYVGKIGDAVQRPTAQELKAYYDSKPALFAARRVYTMQEVLVDADQAQIADLQAGLRKAKSMQEVADYIKERKLPTRATQNTTAAENLPMAALESIAALKDGQTMFAATPTGARLLTLVQSRNAPVTEEQAKPAIEQFLVNEAKRKAVEQDLKTIRSSSHIEYVGQFATRPASAASETATGTTAVPAVPALPSAPAASGIDAAAMNKGLSGLK
jgi:EpsD family peptidyl-prolyl cis-trans isomerase